jgi:hypothetical protein
MPKLVRLAAAWLSTPETGGSILPLLLLLSTQFIPAEQMASHGTLLVFVF